MRNPALVAVSARGRGRGRPGLARLPLAGRAALRHRRGDRARPGGAGHDQRRGDRRRGHRGRCVSDRRRRGRLAARRLSAGGRQPGLSRRGPRHRPDPARHARRDLLHRRSPGSAAAAGECRAALATALTPNLPVHPDAVARLRRPGRPRLLPRLPGRQPGDATPADAIDALRLLEVLDAIYAAGASGRAVDVKRRAIS